MSNVVTLPKMVRIDAFYIEDLTTEEVYEMEAEGRRIVKEHGGKNFYSAETSIGTRMVICDVPEDVVEIVRYELSKMSLATLWYHHDGREVEKAGPDHSDRKRKDQTTDNRQSPLDVPSASRT